MEKPRVIRRWKSFPPYKVDEALSRGFRNQRDSLREILPFLEEEYKANDLKGQLKDLEKKYALRIADWKNICADLAHQNADRENKLQVATKDLEDVAKVYKAEINDLRRQLEDSETERAKANTEANQWKNECVDLTHQNAVCLKQIQDRTMTLDDVTKEIKDLRSACEDFELKKDMRETLSNFKRLRGHDNKRLMDLAQERFPKKFAKESQDLLNFAQEHFGELCKSYNIDKFWDLMKSAHILPPMKVMDLMRTVYKLSLEEFSCVQIRKLIQNQQQEPDSLSKDPGTKKKLRDLKHVIYELFLSKDSREQSVDLMILMRKMFPRYLPHLKFGNLLGKAHELFPEGIPPDRFSSTFTETIAILEKKKSSVKDKELLVDIEDKFCCLKDVAMEYEWAGVSDIDKRRNFGMQFFYLCKGVSRSNIEIFHRPISRFGLMSNDRKGKYMVGNQGVGSAVVAFYHISNTR